jgi:hypothetical protein
MTPIARQARRALLALAVALAIAAAPAPARAADPPSAALKAEARERFDRGVSLFERGDNAGALAEFKHTYALIPNPLVLYNMGLVYAAMNRPVDAADALGDFLSQAGSAISEDQRKHAESVRAEQDKRIAQIVVLTNAPATVEVDGIEAGQTPLAKPIRVSSGAHVVSVLAQGYLPQHKEITLAGQTTETVSLTLQPTESRVAQLVVRAPLPGAEVRVNGKVVGTTPLPASVAVAPGSVHVELFRAGYRTAALTIAIDEGARGELSFALEEDPNAPTSIKGRLNVLASEPGSQISVDGAPLRLLTGALALAAGPHAIRVELGGYEPAERLVDVAAGRETPVVVMLVPTPETRARYEDAARARRIWGWSLAGGGAAVAAVSVIYMIGSQHDLNGDNAVLGQILSNEGMPLSSTNQCSLQQPMTDYQARGCDTIKADAQNQVDTDKLHRNVGIAGAAVGAAVIGAGAYLILTGGDKYGRPEAASTSVAARFWGDARGGGFLLEGRF